MGGFCNYFRQLARFSTKRETVHMTDKGVDFDAVLHTKKPLNALIVGLGRSGVSAALFLRNLGATVTATDLRDASALAEQMAKLSAAGITVEAGGYGLNTFTNRDLIVLSPGVPLETTEIQNAIAAGTPVIGELELASRYLRGSVLGITGTNGKTTTTTLAGKLLAKAGFPTQVGGNIGLPVVDLVPNDTPETWNVLELSSFQLESIDRFRAQIAVVLNITPDHLDRHGSMENYIAAKRRILENQQPGDAAILNADDDIAHRLAKDVRGRLFWFSRVRAVRVGTFVVPPPGQGAVSPDALIVYVAREGAPPEPVMPVAGIPIKGPHNLENVLAAVCAARIVGASAESIRKSVESFRAVEHRLEFVSDINGVAYYNDSKATNVDATIKALQSFTGGIHLILGGKDKDSDYTLLASLVRERVRAVYTIGSAAEKIARALDSAAKIESAETLQHAVQLASGAAQPGDTVLLAPACASFDQFENYEHRGRVFKELVQQLRA
jgi:UDP-N-acetylmuramoylalanine--D-glutamate ligase